MIGRPLVRINFALERYNADFRYRMGRIRENAESIALYHGEPVEERRLSGAFARIFATWWAYMKYNKRLTWLTSFYGQAAIIFPYIVAAPQYFAGQIGLGTMTQTADAFGQVQGSLSWFVDSYTQLAAWKAVVDRLTTFGEAMVAAKRAGEESALLVRPQASPVLALDGVDLNLPDGTPLLRNINLAVRRGEAVVLRGPSGSGKTTLFRALAGLWPFGRGRIATPLADARVLFLPQKPYLPIGSLKDALCYPDPPDPERRQRLPRGAGGVRAVAPVAPAARGRQLVAGALGGRAAAPGLRPRSRLPTGLAVPRRGHLRARRAGREAHVRAPPPAPAPHHRRQHRPSPRRGRLPRPADHGRSGAAAGGERGGAGVSEWCDGERCRWPSGNAVQCVRVHDGGA